MEITGTERFAQLSDREILDRILKGEEALYEIILRRYNPYLYKVARSYGYDHAEAQDLMQDTFVSAYFSLDKFENRSTFKTWIIRIMLNNCYQKAHKASYKNERVSLENTNEMMKPMFSNNKDNDPGQTMANRELGQVIERAITSLPTEYRMVFSLREITGMNTSETATALDITESNVKVRLNRAKKMLRSEIEKMYAAEEIFEFNLIYCDPMVERVMKEIDKKRRTNFSHL